MVDHSEMRLGKLAPSRDPRTLRLSAFMDLEALPTPPPATTRAEAHAGGFPMFANDSLGDCTCAGVAHLQQFWGYLSGQAEAFTDADVISLYESVGGYHPGDPSTDNGAVEVDVLNYWRTNGAPLAGDVKKIVAYAAVNPLHTDMVKAATWLFDGLYIGVALPLTAQRQDVWDLVPTADPAQQAAGSWGGHAVVAFDYNRDGVVIATWGALKLMTWSFWNTYVDEAYAVRSADQFAQTGLSAEGFNDAALAAELAYVTR